MAEIRAERNSREFPPPEIPDENTSYIEDYLLYEERRDIKGTKRTVLNSFFNDLSITQMNPDDFLSVLTEKGTKNLREVISFLKYLSDKGILTDPLLQRLSDNLDGFGSHTPTSFVYALLKSSDYDKAVSNGMLSSHEGRMLFIAAYEKTNGIRLAEPVRRICDEMIWETAFNESVSLKNRWEDVKDLLAVAKTFLSDPNMEFTQMQIADLFKTDAYIPKRARRTGKQFGITMQILAHLDAENQITDPGIQYFLRVLYPVMSAPAGSGTATSRSMEEYITVLSRPRIDLWEILRPPSYKFPMLVFVYAEPGELRDVLIEFVTENCGGVPYKYKKLCEDFSDSFGEKVPTNVLELNYATWLRQIRYFSRYAELEERNNPSSVVNGFYLYIWAKYNQNLFSEISLSPRILKRADLVTLIQNGYEVIPYSTTDSVPYEDKWLLWMGGTERTNSDKDFNGAKAYDFTDIQYLTYREWAKSYLWHQQAAISSKTQNLAYITEFLNILYDLKTGNNTVIYGNNAVHQFNTDVMDEIFGHEAVFIKTLILEKYDQNNAASRISAASNFMSFLRSQNMCVIPRRYKDILSISKEQQNTAKALTDFEMKMVFNELGAMKDENLTNKIAYNVFLLLAWTNLRITEILGLEYDCIVPSAKPTESYLRVKRKTGSGEYQLIPELQRVIGAVKNVLELTENLRDESPDKDICRNLFIIPDKRFPDHAARLTKDHVNKMLKRACRNRGLKEEFTCENLRDTYMNKVKDYDIINNSNEIEHTILSGHTTSATDIKHYHDRKKLRLMLENTYMLVIGDIDKEIFPLQGSVKMCVTKSIAKDKNLVRGGTGWCGDGKCTANGLIDCLICKRFVTDISKQAEFNIAIYDTEEAIRNAANEHEREEQTLVRTILVMYLEQILLLRREMEEEKRNTGS